MNQDQIRLIEEALFQTARIKAHPLPEAESAVRVTTLFKDRNGGVFTFYAYASTHTEGICLTDAGSILRTLQRSGMEVQLGLVQGLVKSYGLMLTQEGAVVAMDDRSLGERVGMLFQAWAAADGVLRTWTRE